MEFRIKPPVKLAWTHHAQAKMAFYRLSPARVRRVLHSPRRIEEGVAPKTVAMMQPASLKNAGGRAGAKNEERWTQEIWVMVEDLKSERRVISAWRYPGVTKARAAVTIQILRREYDEFVDEKTPHRA